MEVFQNLHSGFHYWFSQVLFAFITVELRQWSVILLMMYLVLIQRVLGKLNQCKSLI